MFAGEQPLYSHRSTNTLYVGVRDASARCPGDWAGVDGNQHAVFDEAAGQTMAQVTSFVRVLSIVHTHTHTLTHTRTYIHVAMCICTRYIYVTQRANISLHDVFTELLRWNGMNGLSRSRPGRVDLLRAVTSAVQRLHAGLMVWSSAYGKLRFCYRTNSLSCCYLYL